MYELCFTDKYTWFIAILFKFYWAPPFSHTLWLCYDAQTMNVDTFGNKCDIQNRIGVFNQRAVTEFSL